MAKTPKRDAAREKESRIAAKNRRELIAAGLNRRDLMKMGLLTSAGFLIPKMGLSARPLTSAGYVDNTPQSRATRSFIEDMPRLHVQAPVAAVSGPPPQAVPNTAAGEGRTVTHQAFTRFPPQKLYEVHQRAFQGTASPDLAPSTFWGYDARFPGPLFVARYGEPILVRHFNDLPTENGGFGKNSTSVHLHNGHTPSESDGFPCYWNNQNQFYDHHYPNVLAGFDSTHPGINVNGLPGDINESMHTLWYHDHRIDFTSQNVYKGLAGMYNLFHKEDAAIGDTGNELTGFRLPSFPDYDINMVFNDALYDPTDDQLSFDLFNLDGILGDKFQVNGKIQPVLHVSPRRYRFRWLDMGPSRFYQMFITDPTNLSSKKFWQITTDGNFLPKPVQVDSCRFSVAERVDVIVDFTGLAGKTFYIENRLEQQDGRGPTGKVLNAGQGTYILKIVVDGPVVADNSKDPATITKFYDFPTTTDTPLVTRTFRFERNNGMWAVNGKFANCDDTRFRVKRNSVEKWIIQNNSGAWQHPVHIHFEEFQALKVNGQAPPSTGLITAGRKDVWRLEYNQQVELFFRFRDFRGRLPMHCHNVVHEDHAMMVLWEIDDTGDTNPNP
jgi:FtsP/CotA-like multicopper oxidase with cupredoxin domain